MAYFNFKNIKISAMVSAVPPKIVRGEEFYDRFGKEYVHKFQESTGVKEFRTSSIHQTASDFAYVAAEDIIKRKGLDRCSIGLLVYATLSFDYKRPSTCCVLHKRLQLSKDCAAYDVKMGCSGFMYGLQTACASLLSSDATKALFLFGETSTKLCNPKDQSIAMLMGDGGGAILLEKTIDNCEISEILRTDGMGYQAIITPAGDARNSVAPHTEFTMGNGIVRSMYDLHLNGDDVFSFTISEVPKTIKEFLLKTNTSSEDYDCFACHQANRFIINLISKKINFDSTKVPTCLEKYGNTGPSSAIHALCDKYGMQTLDKDLSVLIIGFGVGLSWGVGSFKINANDIYPIIETDEVFAEGIINSPQDFL